MSNIISEKNIWDLLIEEAEEAEREAKTKKVKDALCILLEENLNESKS